MASQVNKEKTLKVYKRQKKSTNKGYLFDKKPLFTQD